MSKKIEVNKGDKYGDLVIIEEVSGNHRRTFNCLCACGSIGSYQLFNLRSGNTKSCGCYHSAIVRTHNMGNSKIYNIWKQMKYRCMVNSHPRYSSYGGRGITVCQNRLAFENFHNDMYSTYSEGLSLERKDNNGNYCKENCVRITVPEQSLNQRQNIIYLGRPLALWGRELGIPKQSIYKRIKRGWTIEQALLLENTI